MVTVNLSMDEMAARAVNIKYVFTDCDGVLTDGSIYYSARGEEMRRFSFLDGMGTHLLRTQGIGVGIISGENSEIILRRAEKLKLTPVFLGIQAKLECIKQFIVEQGLTPAEVAYIGDDVNDVALMRFLYHEGITGCPPGATEEVYQYAHYKTVRSGGNGAFREFADIIIALRGHHINNFPNILTIKEI